jgi:LysM repeat protein
VPPDDGKRGTPVEIREQPEISAGPLPSAVRRSGNVTIYDDIRYPVRPNDTYASISQLKYGSDRYAEALAAYNRERNPRAAKPLPGMNVLIPPVEILERDYRNVIASGSPGSGPESPPAVPPAPPFRRDASPEVRMEPTRPAATARAGEKTYRVRTGDTLWNISKQTLGNGERWVEILRINRDVLPDINRLQDGLILRLPADAKVDTGARPQ